MKSSENRKKEIIAHLEWCIEKMNIYESSVDGEKFEHLYRDIFNLISAMQEMESKAACAYYHKVVADCLLAERLTYYQIELAT